MNTFVRFVMVVGLILLLSSVLAFLAQQWEGNTGERMHLLEKRILEMHYHLQDLDTRVKTLQEKE